MNIAIIGSHEFKDIILVDSVVELEIIPKFRNDLTIISSGAKGVDEYVAKLARQHEIRVIEYKPNFSSGYDINKYHERNDRIIENADRVIAFWDGKSRGTKSVIDKCLQRKKHIEVIFDR